MTPSRHRWLPPVVHGGAVAVIVLGLMYHWFALADRYVVFLYNHHDRPGEPAAAPFDPVTRSRYWMTGFVAAGVVLATYTAASWLVARYAQRRGRPTAAPPPWQLVWLCAAPLLAVGIPAITLTQNSPTLPLPLALEVTATALLGLALALVPARWAAKSPRALAWLALDGLGVAVPMLTWRAFELPPRGIMDTPPYWLIVGSGLVGGVVWLAVLTRAYRAMGQTVPGAADLYLAGVIGCFLGAPLVHHLFFTPPGFHYITSAPNVIGYDVFTRISGLVLGAAVAAATTRWRAARSQRQARLHGSPSITRA